MKHGRTITMQALLALLICTLLAGPALAAPAYLIPSGQAVGIELYGEGLLVTEVEERSAAEQAGIRKGDVIVAVNGLPVNSAQQLAASLDGKNPAVLRVARSGKEAEFLVQAEPTADGCRLGVWLRDHIAGIGTLTYIDPMTGAFGALGHGVSDPAGSTVLPLDSGAIVRASVAELRRGRAGAPGELHGIFDETGELGTITKNTAHGIFGTFTAPQSGKAMAVAPGDEVQTGQAEILSTVDGESVQAFKVEIEKINRRSETGRDLRIRVTDEALLEKTGGIVQGMSGSPIIQNGRLIGAVTHVLVNDPTRGYGILIENMLDDAA